MLVFFLLVLGAVPSAASLSSSATRGFAGELGAIVQKTPGGRAKSTLFRVWAPHAESVAVTGTFNHWNPRRHAMKKEGASGVWSLEVREAKPGDEYMFLINGEVERKDPRARMVTSSEGKGVIYDTSGFDWGRDWRRPEVALGDLVIYQLHPGTFHDPDPQDGEPGTLHEAIAKLDHLAQMGINCVLLMPVNEFAGRYSWGYNPSDLFAIESAYGGPDVLKEFVKACH